MTRLDDTFADATGYDRPTEQLIGTVAGLPTFRVPDTHWTPDVWVYFDFTRAVTADPDTLVTEGVVPDTATTFGLEQAQARVDFYYDIFKKFDDVFGTTLNVSALTAPGAQVGTTDAKQNFLNLVLRHFISNVAVKRTSTGPSTANITFTFQTYDERHRSLLAASSPELKDDLLFWNHFFSPTTARFTVLDQLLTPHTWVYIYGRGRFDPKNYYPIFTGFTNRVTHSNQAGYTALQVGCEDTLKLLHKTQIRANPATADRAGEIVKAVLGENQTFYNHILAGEELDSIVNFLLLGDKVPGTRVPAAAVHDYELMFPPKTPDDTKLATYINSRVIPAVPTEGMAAEILTKKRVPNQVIMWGVDIIPYRTLFPMKAPGFFSSDFINRLEAMREVATRSMIEFYADAQGSYVIHPYRLSPPFLTKYAKGTALIPDVAGAQSAYVFSSEELKAADFTLTDDQLVTALVFQGQQAETGSFGTADFLGKRVPAISPDLMSRYGLWYAEHQEPLVNFGINEAGTGDINENIQTEPVLLQLFAFARLAYNNKDIYNGQATVPFRPELEVARPAYFPDRRDIGYIMSIDHNFPVGGDATTSVSMSFCRKIDALPIDFTDFLIQSGETVPQMTAAEIQVLLTLFEAASGFNRLDPNLEFSIGSPGSIQGNPTLNKFIETAFQAQQAGTVDKSQFLQAIIDTAGIRRVESSV